MKNAPEPVTRRVELALKASPEALWPLVSNTERQNRFMGMPPSVAGAPSADYSRPVSARLLGVLPLRWRELPFEFSAGRFYRTVREFETGPFLRIEASLRLEPAGSGTRAVVEQAVVPRAGVLRPVVALATAKAARDMAAFVSAADRSLDFGDIPCPARTATPSDLAQLESRGRVLRGACGASAACAERLLTHLAKSPDDAVMHMRPYELADAWGLPRRDVLTTCLRGVKSGLLDLSWEVLCPNCAGAGSHASLAELKEKGHCPSCKIEFGSSLDESVELRFSVHPGVRKASSQTYCVGSPAHSRHALAQIALGPEHGPRELTVSLKSRSYALRGVCSRKVLRLRPRADGPSVVTADLAAAAHGQELPFKPGEVRLALSSGDCEVARVEREDWMEGGATAAQVSALQCFRDLFGAEVLTPGVRIGVKRMALLFTDLKGSTALYEKIGDATAYSLVRDHFDYLFKIIEDRGGAVVKTIGDAVMAVFASPADALEAALDMQERMGELNARLAPRPPVVLKIGVHEGPAIAINADGRLDYFGTTANTAARVQNESVGGEVVVTEALAADPAVAAVLARRAPRAEEFRMSLKGLSGDFKLRRLWVK